MALSGEPSSSTPHDCGQRIWKKHLQPVVCRTLLRSDFHLRPWKWLSKEGSCSEDFGCPSEAQSVTPRGTAAGSCRLPSRPVIPGVSAPPTGPGTWHLLSPRALGDLDHLTWPWWRKCREPQLPTFLRKHNQEERRTGPESRDQHATSVYGVALVSSTSVERWLETPFLSKWAIGVAI